MIYPLIDLPLEVFPAVSEQAKKLKALREKAVRSDGWFMMKCDKDEIYETQFVLTGEHEGEWMLGKISAYKFTPTSAPRFSVVVYCGLQDLEACCHDEAELLEVLYLMEADGMTFVTTTEAYWDISDRDDFGPHGFDKPFDILIQSKMELIHG